MKRARIALGVVVIGGIVAFLLSWPDSLSKYPIDFETFSPATYDRVTPKQIVTTFPYHPKIKTEKVMLASNNK